MFHKKPLTWRLHVSNHKPPLLSSAIISVAVVTSWSSPREGEQTCWEETLIHTAVYYRMWTFEPRILARNSTNAHCLQLHSPISSLTHICWLEHLLEVYQNGVTHSAATRKLRSSLQCRQNSLKQNSTGVSHIIITQKFLKFTLGAWVLFNIWFPREKSMPAFRLSERKSFRKHCFQRFLELRRWLSNWERLLLQRPEDRSKCAAQRSCKLSSRRHDALFWLPQVPAHIWYACGQAHMST